jgi:GNAT superfamily N-acetyltransferase
MTATLQIRPLTESDLAETALKGAAFYREGKLPGRFVPEVFTQTWRQLLGSGIGTLIGLEIDGRIEGALGGVKSPDPNDGDLVAVEMFWFVDANHRGHGLKLLDAFEEWAHQQGCKRVGMIHLLQLMPDKLEVLYRRRKYQPVEVHYLKEL